MDLERRSRALVPRGRANGTVWPFREATTVVDESVLIGMVAAYARTIAADYGTDEVAELLAGQVVEALRIDGAAVSVTDGGTEPRLVAATDHDVASVEEYQAALDQGPCRDAFRGGGQVTSADLQADDRWPDYSPIALDQGFQAVAGVPMVAGDRCIGSLGLYCRSPCHWDEGVLAVAGVLADLTAGFIANAHLVADQRIAAAQLQHALESRIVIEQAKGRLAERHGIDLTAAFERLRRNARDHNRRLAEVARAVVDGGLQL